MDIKDLNKSQLILLAILLSFITSIATGITTVTLMQQAPQSVTAPINNVVRQTIEKIQQVEGKTTVNTVVVKEEDLIVDALAKNQSAVFALSKDGYDLEGNKMELAAGRAFAVSNSDIVVTDARMAPGQEKYYVKNSSGKFKAEFIASDKGGFSFLKIGEPLDPVNKLAYTVPTAGDLSKMKIGQKIIILGTTLSSSIYEGDDHLTVPRGDGGGIVLNLDGQALGVALSGESVSFASIGDINTALTALNAPKAQ
ncbi:MAG: hypothetical protein KBC06_00630 [Candidatus Pacebacteria bacterium]|nr:hypothetical protein [Candidatus Paceibacterota bacterium]